MIAATSDALMAALVICVSSEGGSGLFLGRLFIIRRSFLFVFVARTFCDARSVGWRRAVIDIFLFGARLTRKNHFLSATFTSFMFFVVSAFLCTSTCSSSRTEVPREREREGKRRNGLSTRWTEKEQSMRCIKDLEWRSASRGLKTFFATSRLL